MVLSHAIDEGEADAAALGFGGEERLEDMGEVGVGDAVTRVADPELEAPGSLAGQKASPHAELAAVGHGLHGVDAEIPDGLAELLGIHAGGEALAVLADDFEGTGTERCSTRSTTSSRRSARLTSCLAMGAGRAYSRKSRMIRFRRSDSRSTISTSRSRVGSWGSSLTRASMAPESEARGLRISWAMLADSRPMVASRSAWR